MMTPDFHENPLPGSRLKHLIVVGFGLVALAVIYSVVWWIIAERALYALDRWVEQQQQAGYSVQWDDVEISGYPFQLIARLESPHVERSGGGGFNGIEKWTWSIDSLVLSGRPWRWRKLRMDVPGTHELMLEENGSQAPRSFTLEAEGLAIDAEFENDDWKHIRIAANALRLTEKDQVISELQSFSGDLRREPIASADEGTQTGSVQLDIRNLNLPTLQDDVRRIAGSVVQRAALKAEIYGPLPDNLSRRILSIWRDAGGVMEIRQMLAEYGPLSMEAEGTLALDGQLQPVGSFVSRLEGYAEVIDALQMAEAITESDALTAKLVLGAMAKRDAATGKSHLSIPINIQDRTVYAGPLAVMKLPPLEW